MSENLKKGLLIGVIVLAVLVGGWQVMKTMNSETPHVEAVVNTPAGHKSEKELALEAQAKGNAPVDAKNQEAKESALAGN